MIFQIKVTVACHAIVNKQNLHFSTCKPEGLILMTRHL